MNITITKRMFDKMTDAELALFTNRGREYLRGQNSFRTPLLKTTEGEREQMRAVLVRLSKNTRNVKSRIEDIDNWAAIISDGGSGDVLPKTLRSFADLLTEYIRTAPGNRIYRLNEEREVWEPFYVNYITYEPEQRDHRDRSIINAACITISLLYWELGAQRVSNVTLRQSKVDGMSVRKALAANDMVIETPELRQRYLDEKAAFDAVWEKVGQQYTIIGVGESEGRWKRKVNLASDGVPARVVLDVVVDHSIESRDRFELAQTGHIKQYFWFQKDPRAVDVPDTDDLGLNRRLSGEDFPEADPPEIPIRPNVVVYHLAQHDRFKVNAADLTLYEYDKQMREQLILPDITKSLVDTLVSQGRISFTDIIAGKGTGACILLGGQPGVGKTLTAEVFAEATERPLLSVQAAQLGTDADKVEDNLRDILSKGSRWNAVVLLDEADVYISERSANLHQNAIVAAFLRRLEHHTATIFMTTNRLESVDDAVISRCLARIDYDLPSRDAQRDIWGVLNRLNGAGLSDSDIETIVEQHNDLSGRDIKQLLKLASLWCENHEEEIGPRSIGFVRQFLPTRAVKAPALDEAAKQEMRDEYWRNY